MTDLFTFAEATKARDAGMRQAVEHADEKHPAWSDQALAWIKRYAELHSERFISEECTRWIADRGFTSPTDPRAWGAPFRKASNLGYIVRVGYGTSLRRHRSATPLWQSAIYRRAA